MKLMKLLTEYKIHHKSFTDAAKLAFSFAKSKGYLIDEDDWYNLVTLGGSSSGRSRPGIGKTNSFKVGLLKNDKPQKKMLNFSVYGMESGNYELNAYIN